MNARDYLLSYIHPHDLDASQPMMPDLPAARSFKSYVGLAGAERKFHQFLTDFKFTDIATAEKSVDWKKARVIKAGCHYYFSFNTETS